MIVELDNVKIIPINNPDVTILNKDSLINMIKKVPIINIENLLIGWVIGSKLHMKNNMIISNIYIEESCKDYEFCNYEYQSEINKDKSITIKKIQCIVFERSNNENNN